MLDGKYFHKMECIIRFPIFLFQENIFLHSCVFVYICMSIFSKFSKRNLCWQKKLFLIKIIHDSTIYNCQSTETSQVPISGWMNTQIIIHIYHRILVSHKKEWSTDACYDVSEPPKHYAKSKKLNTEGYILYDSIYMKYPE